jgi:hypothetical protein
MYATLAASYHYTQIVTKKQKKDKKPQIPARNSQFNHEEPAPEGKDAENTGFLFEIPRFCPSPPHKPRFCIIIYYFESIADTIAGNT